MLSHLDKQGKAKMVDVSEKDATFRKARAACKLIMKKETLDLITEGKIAKGDVFTTAKIAGIMAAKKTSELIPMCHPLNITNVGVEFEQCRAGSPNTPVELCISSEVKTKGQTGVEMEALTACSVAALTVYDMVKAVEEGIKITDLKLIEKSGGKSGTWQSLEK